MASDAYFYDTIVKFFRIMSFMKINVSLSDYIYPIVKKKENGDCFFLPKIDFATQNSHVFSRHYYYISREDCENAVSTSLLVCEIAKV